MKRILGVALCMLLLFALVPSAVGAATEEVTVYLDSQRGADSNSGLTEAKAVQTFEGAYKVLHDKLDGTTGKSGKIVLVSDYQYDFTEENYRSNIASASYSHSYDVIICGKTAKVALTFTMAKQSYWTMLGPTTFENLNIRIADKTTNRYLSIHGCGGSYLKIGSGVTTTDDPNRQISLVAAPNSNSSKSCALEISSGAWRNVFASAFSSNVTIKGSASLTINGGSFQKVAAVYNGKHQGDVTITINGGTVPLLDAGTSNTGTVTGNSTVNICGGVLESAVTSTGVSGESTVILAPAKGVTLQAPLTVNRLTGGQLTFSGEGQLTVTDAVTNVTTVTAEAGLSYRTYVKAPAATAESAVVFTQQGATTSYISGSERLWSCDRSAQKQGLVLRADSEVKVELRTDFTGGTLLTPVYTVTDNGFVDYYYPDLSGNYRYTVSGEGYYTVTKNIYVSPMEATTNTVMDVTPSKAAGTGWEASKISLYTDELLNNKPCIRELWPAYREAFETPFFTNTHAEHQYTTQQELEDYLEKLAAKTPNMYVFSAGQSGYGLNVPLVIFTTTDLSGAKTLEQAAALVRGNGKMTVQYQAQMHGNETAAGEGALAMVQKLSGSYGDKLTENLNVYVLPRLNPDGTERYKRALTVTDLDMNKDFLLLRAVETRNVQQAAQLFKPAMIIDSHEYTAETDIYEDKFSDLLTSAGYHPISSAAFRETSIAMLQSVFGAMDQQGLTYGCYSEKMNSTSNYVSRNYASVQGTLFFLLESRGTGSGSVIYGRRVVTHLVAATQLLDYAYENHAQLSALVAAERQQIIDRGTTYESTDVIPLKNGSTAHPELNIQTVMYNTATGEGTAYVQKVSEYDRITRSRIAPTAYVLPAGERWTQQVLDLMDLHGISYTFLPKGSNIRVRQYIGTTTSASLTAEKSVTFSGGCYLFTMNQVGAMILANLLEPDVNDISAGASTLAMAGIIPCENEVFPIYRYVHDLNSQGMVDYVIAPDAPTGLTVEDILRGQSGAIKGLSVSKLYEYSYNGGEYVKLPAGTTSITVTEPGTYAVRYQATQTQVAGIDAYMDVGYKAEHSYVIYLSETGNDSKTGRTKAQAVATVAKAYSLLASLMKNAPAGTEGQIIVIGMVDLGADQVTFPKHTYPVKITGYVPSHGFTHEGGSTTTSRCVNFSGPTTLEYISWSLTSESEYNYFCANGNKLVIGQGFTSLLNKNSTFYNICGGGYSGTFASTDLTIQSGGWRNIYYGNYKGTITGDAKVTMTGGSFSTYLQATYAGTIQGDCYVTISNVQLGDRLIAGSKSDGTVNGDATVTLGAGLAGKCVVAALDKGALKGTYTLILDGADTTAMTVNGYSAMTGTCGGSALILKSGIISTFTNMDQVILRGSVQLGSDITSNMTVEGDSVLDLNGKVLTGNLSGSGTLYGVDTATDNYSTSTGRITGKVTCKVEVHHRQTQTLKRYVAIKDNNGYTFHRFYMAITHMNLRPNVNGVGYKAVFYGDEQVRSQVAGYGYTLWVGENGKKLSVGKDGSFISGKIVTARLQNVSIMSYSEVPVYGQAYLTLKDGTTVESAACSYTLRSLVEHIAANTKSFTTTQLNAVKAMLAPYAALTSKWNIEGLK